MWEAALLGPYRIQDSEMRPNEADGSTSPKAAHSSRYTEGLRERFEPRVETVLDQNESFPSRTDHIDRLVTH
jgi:hypothetical protein